MLGGLLSKRGPVIFLFPLVAPGAPRNLRSAENEPRVERQLRIEWLPPKEANGEIRHVSTDYRVVFIQIDSHSCCCIYEIHYLSQTYMTL